MHSVALGVETIVGVWCEEERSWISRREESDGKKQKNRNQKAI